MLSINGQDTTGVGLETFIQNVKSMPFPLTVVFNTRQSVIRAAEKAATEKAVAEKAFAEQVAADKVAAEKWSSGNRFQFDKALADAEVAEKAAAAEKLATDKAAAEKATADKVAGAKAIAVKALEDQSKLEDHKGGVGKLYDDVDRKETVPNSRVILMSVALME